jgi:hypothetical protein
MQRERSIEIHNGATAVNQRGLISTLATAIYFVDNWAY